MIAMTGMFLMGNQVFSSFGMGTVLVVAIALVGSLTVLPAVLSLLGDRIDRGRIPGLQRLRAKPGESRFWAPIIRVVLRWPVLCGGGAVALLVALAIPAFSLHTVSAGMQGLPPNLPVMKAYERVQQAFPGGAEPETVVISAPDVTSPQVTAGIAALEQRALATGRMFEPITVDISASHQAARVSIPLVGTGVDAASLSALALLRNTVIPATIGRVPGVTVHTTGEAGQTVDFNDTMKSHAPYVFAFVLGLAFLLLLLTFRSIVIPLTTIVLNLLSVGAAYGVLVVDLPAGPPAIAARLHLDRRHHRLAAALPLRDPVRPLDGLPRVHSQPRPRSPRPRNGHRGRRRARHQGKRRRRHERRDRDGRRLRNLRHPRRDRLPDARRRPRRRDLCSTPRSCAPSCSPRP